MSRRRRRPQNWKACEEKGGWGSPMSSAEGPVTHTRMLAALTNMAGKSQPHRIPNILTVYHACLGLGV